MKPNRENTYIPNCKYKSNKILDSGALNLEEVPSPKVSSLGTSNTDMSQ